MTPLTYLETRNDAGLLREYVTERYGSVLAFGGPADSYDRARSLVRRVAKLAGICEAEALRDIVSDVTWA